MILMEWEAIHSLPMAIHHLVHRDVLVQQIQVKLVFVVMNIIKHKLILKNYFERSLVKPSVELVSVIMIGWMNLNRIFLDVKAYHK